MRLGSLPRLSLRGTDTLEYGIGPGLRILAGGLAFLVLAAGPLFYSTFALRSLSWIAILILGVVALSEDGWEFVSPGAAESGTGVNARVRRRTGFFFWPRGWDLPFSELSSLELRRGKSGESVTGRKDRGSGWQTVLSTMGLPGRGSGAAWVALILVLRDGHCLALATGTERDAESLSADGTGIAGHLGLPFIFHYPV